MLLERSLHLYQFLILLSTICVSIQMEDDGFCYPGEQCFPSDDAIRNMGSELDGSVIFKTDADYANLNKMYNDWTLKYPKVIVLVKSTKDVQKAIVFARQYNLRVAVKSTGHDFNGRSTAEGAFEINLSAMQGLTINTSSSLNSAGIIDIEAGRTWISIYKEVDKVNRVIVGGSAHTVGVSGYTLGGGHSPVCRALGLAVDNLLEVEMVTANGSLVVANSNSTVITDTNGQVTTKANADLFWALRGGGGGTYGIATRFMFKLHNPVGSKVVRLSLAFPIISAVKERVGEKVLDKFFEILPGMPREWGGYVMINGYPYPEFGTVGGIHFYFNYQGEFDTPGRRYMDQLVNYRQDTSLREYKVLKDFLDYEQNVTDASSTTSALFNSLLNENSLKKEGLSEFIISTAMSYPNDESIVTFTGALMGGKMMEIPSDQTSVHPGFRSGLISLSGAVSWDHKRVTDPNRGIRSAVEISEKLSDYGDGMYPNEACIAVKNWQNQFWGTNYNRLLEIKKEWDPSNFFTCVECVGGSTYDIASKANTISSTIFTWPFLLALCFILL